MKPQVQGDVQDLSPGSRIVTAIQGRPVVSATPPVGSSYVWNGTNWMPGGRIAHGTNTSGATTSATTFGTGVDLLSTALKFTATGSSDYIIQAFAPNWSNSVSGNENILHVNLDGADAGVMAYMAIPAVSFPNVLTALGYITKPALGAHTVNVRLRVTAGTATVGAGAGGANVNLPIVVTLELV